MGGDLISDPPAPRIAGVLETCLYAIDLDATSEFYARILGLEAFARVDGRHVFFRCGRSVLLLFNPERTAEPGGEVPPHGARGPGHVALAVAAADLPLWRSFLLERRIVIEAEVDWPGGGSSLYLRDPAGNSVELTSPTIWQIPEAEYLSRADTEVANTEEGLSPGQS